MCVCVFLFLFVCQSAYAPVFPYVFISICVSIQLSIYLSIFVYLSIYLSAFLRNCPRPSLVYHLISDIGTRCHVLSCTTE